MSSTDEHLGTSAAGYATPVTSDDWLSRWRSDDYEMEGDELEVIVDMFNSVGESTRRPTFLLSWFSIRDQFEGGTGKVPSVAIRSNQPSLDEYFGMSFDEKHVSTTELKRAVRNDPYADMIRLSL